MAIKSADLSKYGFSAANQTEVLRQRDAHERRLGEVGTPIPKPAKYRNRRVNTATGEHLDSGAESRMYSQLLLRQQAGEISNLRRQVKWECQVNGVKIGRMTWTIDFAYYDEQRDENVWHEVKPCRKWRSLHQKAALKVRLWMAGGPGLLIISWPLRGGWESEQITPAPPQGGT